MHLDALELALQRGRRLLRRRGPLRGGLRLRQGYGGRVCPRGDHSTADANDDRESRSASGDVQHDYFLPSDALMSATFVNRSGFSECTDMIRSGSSFSRSMLSRNTIVPVTGGLGTGAAAVGRLNMSA